MLESSLDSHDFSRDEDDFDTKEYQHMRRSEGCLDLVVCCQVYAKEEQVLLILELVTQLRPR